MSLGYFHISPVTRTFTQENINFIQIIAVLTQLKKSHGRGHLRVRMYVAQHC